MNLIHPHSGQNRFRQAQLRSLSLLVACFIASLFSVGCHSTRPASASFASVVIKGQNDEAIRNTTVAVFQENGYAAFSMGTTLVFEKEGSRANTIAWDGLAAAQAGASTIVRVRIELVDLGVGARRVQGQAYMVRDAGDSFFEEEVRLANIRSRPYQNLLDEVAKRLKQP